MSDRKAELDRKKAKLQAIRENKERKRRELELKSHEEATPRHERDPVKEVEDMLSSLGITPVSDVLSSLSSSASIPPDADQLTATPPSSLQTSTTTLTPRRYVSGKEEVHLFDFFVSTSRNVTLTVVKGNELSIPAKELIVYTKQTQTSSSGPERDGKLKFLISN